MNEQRQVPLEPSSGMDLLVRVYLLGPVLVFMFTRNHYHPAQALVWAVGDVHFL